MKRVKPRLAISKKSTLSAFDAVVLPPKSKPYVIPPDFGDDYIPGIWPENINSEKTLSNDAAFVSVSSPPKTLGVEATTATTLASLQKIDSTEPPNNKNSMPEDTPADTTKDTQEEKNSEQNSKNLSAVFGRKRILCLDPSATDTVGYCLITLEWDEAGVILKEGFNFGSWSLSGMNFLMRCVDLKDYITADIGDFEELIVEWPMFYDSQKGHVAARQGYTINLAGIAMFIVGWFQIPHQQVFLYTAPDWKGSVPKKVTARRFFKMFDINVMDVDEHCIDATMMGVYHISKTMNNPTE